MAVSISQSARPGLIAVEAPERVRDGLAALGRTEDVRLSPSGTRLAIACYLRDEVAVVDVELERESPGGEARVVLTDIAFHGSAALAEPHGLDFVDDETLVVANRGGELVVLRLPPAGASGEAPAIGSTMCELGAAGSVAVRASGAGDAEVLAVHNWANAVTRYRLAEDGSLTGGEVVLQRWLDLPDGIATSARGEWLAISNHDTHDVLVFGAEIEREAEPAGVLRGVAYPHGLRFAHEDRLLLVADAGAPYVSAYTRPGDAWAGVSYSPRAIRVMDDETFAAGHRTPQEGGPKGLEVDELTNVLVVTAEHTPLAFFDLDRALEAATVRPADELVRCELERLRGLANAKAERDEARAQLDAVLRTKAWRLTSPLRGAYGALRGFR